MLLSSDDGPIDLKLLGSLLSTQIIELGYATPPRGETMFSPGGPVEAVRDAVEQFRMVVESDVDANQARRALAWLLNLPDDRLLATTSELRMAFPVADVRQRRQFLELLWIETFAGWTVDGFDPDGYEFIR